MKVIILSGISGIGKSTYCEKILQGTQGIKVSADHYFIVNGRYRFDPHKLTEAHTDCFRRFLDYMHCGHRTIVVDNTNIDTWEISPYVLAAEAYKYDPEVHTLQCASEADFRLAAARNIHCVPEHTVRKQWQCMQKRHLPPHWKEVIVPMGA